MEAKGVKKLPTGEGWQFEPKWDGFRCLAFRDQDDVVLQSKAGLPLGRYFPEIVAAVSALEPRKFVLDGEIVIPSPERTGYSFDDLQQRIHPAASRVTKLSQETPGVYMVFDVLVDAEGGSLLEKPLAERRPRLEEFAARFFPDMPRVKLVDATTDAARLARWQEELRGKGFDGIIAKKRDMPYAYGERTGMQKFKWIRTADCVVGGFRYGAGTKLVGSLLLGLYDEEGVLHHVGFTSGLKAPEKPALTAKLEALRKPPGFSGRAPGGPSRWTTERSGGWEPLAPELVVEVSYDHWSGGRFRHGTGFLRWRPDKAPAQCTLGQIRD
jgi:ATP-dependent DNA ligase